MGILNLTPDSFSGDGLLNDVDAAVARARAMVAEGADLIDVGGESTRPGSDVVPEPEELARVLPVVERLVSEIGVPVSIDTRKARVAEAALSAGASLLNDVSGLEFDPRIVEVAARSGAALIVGHWRQRRDGDPADTVDWIATGLEASIARASALGVERTQILADPGIGFAKGPTVSLEVLRRLPELRARLGLPILIGASRKSFIGRVLDLPVTARLEGSLAAAVIATMGGADLVRVHDVLPAARAVRLADAVARGWSDPPPTWTSVYLGLGANLGDRAANIAAAIRALSTPGFRPIRRSRLYETDPVGVVDQPRFLNAVLEGETTLQPRALLDLAKGVERSLGRQPGPRWGPRPIDIDILLFGDRRVHEPDLTIPHAELWKRSFVLAPLAELRPDLEAPDGRALRESVADEPAAAIRALGF